jgi:glutamate-1-semialdehyde 2,1-aminomutase
MILGHSHPEIVKGVSEAISKGTHLSSSSEMEMKWARLVKELIPSVEKLRFHSSGTEAVMMAFRMVRVFTGKTKIVRFQDAFHGWADGPYVGTDTDHSFQGIPEGTRKTMIVLPYDLEAVERTLDSDNDVAAVILQGNKIMEPSFAQKLRSLTEQKGVLLVVDEVVSGFRWSRAGAQGVWGIKPDLSTMAKILAGGLPGGCVGGRADVVDTIGTGKISHPGTFNANPLSATAGATALSIVANEPIGERALDNANRLKAGLNNVLTKLEVPGCVYGTSSILQTRFGADHECDHIYCPEGDKAKGGWSKNAKDALVQALANRGVYAWENQFILSAAHTEEFIDQTVDAFEGSLKDMRADGFI